MKLYDQNEIAAILRKAAETSPSEGDDRVTGLSIEELKELASDAGIDPAQVARAARELAEASDAPQRGFWGGPFSFHRQTLVDGEISVAQWEEMLVAVRDFFRSNGDVGARESTWEWSSPKGTTNSAQVTAVKSQGKTRITVGWQGPLTAIPFFLPVPVVTVLSLLFASEFLELSSVPGVAFALAATGLAFMAGRWALGRSLNKGFRKLRQLVADLDLIASQEEAPMEVTTGDQKQESSLNEILEADSGEAAQAEAPPQVGTKRGRVRS